MGSKILRDAVHGDIELTALEIEIIDTPEFQRLRGIKQLGTASLVFPSALHTRFEHSIGAAWMAQRILDAIRRTHEVSREESAEIRIAALLHDITHIPYGHTLEDERRVLPRHDKDEDRRRQFLREGSIGRILEREGLQDRIVDAVRGHGGLAADIATGPISADLLDYLRRDTYFTGLSQYYDARIFSSFIVHEGRLAFNLEKNGRLRRDALSELVNLLRIRYTLSERVYFHHAKIASGAMISKIVETALGEGFATESLRTLRDETLLWVIGRTFGANPAVAHLEACLNTRKLYRPCYSLGVEIPEEARQRVVNAFHEDRQGRESAEQALAAAAGIEPWQVIVYCPAFGMSLPEAEVPARMDEGRLLPLSSGNNEEIRILKDKHKALWKLFVLIDRAVWHRREIVARAAADRISAACGITV
ncbi:MAG TPA: HD domain-containing protein [Terriglobia bacterium]|nr:HD domain-containing protein [Terriglobia bacterium]